nr:response regulator [uncultured Blautia sp.]
MDVQMPEMDGYEATRRIRRLENQEIASKLIIAMTANAFEEDVQEALKAGMNDHMAKLIRIETLYALMKKYL